ncbi:MAG TPA: hypothetical protein VLG11_01515 [Candidatus Saccharimonadales bacterium]|nr:hypothetical protein [Candidatus Saccharimonadales bacterium]
MLGFAGYGVYKHQNAKTARNSSTNGTTQTSSADPAKATNVAASPKISSTGDLDKASAILDHTDPDGSNGADASQLDAQSANF